MYFYSVVFWILCTCNCCIAADIWNEWSPQVSGLKLRIGCEKSVFRVGEEISINFEIINVSKNEILLAKQETLGGEQRPLVGNGLFLKLKILHDPVGEVFFDNRAFIEWQPPTTFVKLLPSQVLKGKIRFDSATSFYTCNKGVFHLFGDAEHVGLSVPGGYNVKLVLDIKTERLMNINWRCRILNYNLKLAIDINKDDIEHQDEDVIWNGKIVSNEITFLIQKNSGQITNPAPPKGSLDLW